MKPSKEPIRWLYQNISAIFLYNNIQNNLRWDNSYILIEFRLLHGQGLAYCVLSTRRKNVHFVLFSIGEQCMVCLVLDHFSWWFPLWHQCSHKSWKPSSLAEWLALPLDRHDELLASNMIIDRQNGKDWVYVSEQWAAPLATDKCWEMICAAIHTKIFF